MIRAHLSRHPQRRAAAEAIPLSGALRSRAVVVVDCFAVIVFASLLAPLVLRLAAVISTPATAFAATMGALLGYFAADVVSGVVHWFCDRFLEEDTPLIGPLVIAPFREHHRDPRAMTRHGFLELSGNSCLGVAPLLALGCAWPLAVWGDAVLAAFAVAVLTTNLAHGWAHAAHPPRLTRRLQACGLLLRPSDHAVHHTPGHRGAYCVMNGWANRWLDGSGVFGTLEHALVRLGVPATRQP